LGKGRAMTKAKVESKDKVLHIGDFRNPVYRED
jgi:hypothetical protein